MFPKRTVSGHMTIVPQPVAEHLVGEDRRRYCLLPFTFRAERAAPHGEKHLAATRCDAVVALVVIPRPGRTSSPA